MFGLGYQELIVIFLIVLILFGGAKIPELARGLGKGIREFRKAKDSIHDTVEESLREEEAKQKKEEKEAKELNKETSAPEAQQKK